MTGRGAGADARPGVATPLAAVDPRRALWARRLYGWLLALLAPVYRLRLWWRGRREPLYRHAVDERFGVYAARSSEAVRGAGDGHHPVPRPVWIHAVSLGETRAAAALIEALRRQQPDLRLLLTHSTATGREAGAALLRPGDAQAWLPYDAPAAVARFLAHWRPSCGVLMETEIWPGLLHAAAHAGVPMVLANARLSERSFRRGRRFAPLLQPAVASLAGVLAQTEDDAHRLRLAGAPRVEVMGNLKFDMTPDPAQVQRGRRWAAASVRPVVLAASTREGEEAALLQAWIAARPEPATPADLAQRPRLLIVARHPQRFDEVAQRIERAGLSLARRSAWLRDAPDADALAVEVWLGDSLGEMPAYYASASVALLGGSFAPLGGQNLIEAAACGCPLLMGPHTFNFSEAATLSRTAGAALEVADFREALVRLQGLLAEPARLAAMSQRALAFAGAHRGAAERMAQRILEGLAAR